MNAKKEKLPEEWQKEKETLQKQLHEQANQLREITRKLEIEASLERVRAQSIAMHKSDELAEVVRQIKKEIMELGIDIDVTQIATDFTNDPRDGMNDWASVEGRRYLEKFHIPFLDHSLTTKFYETLNNDLGHFTATYSKSEKNDYFKLLFKHSDFKDTSEKRKNLILNASGWIICGVILENSSVLFSRYNLNEFAKEDVEIFKRFGKVFGQAYTRFLDLQKAEAQAREAQIEAALERVRARTMAMQHSDELVEASQLLDEQVRSLGIETWGCAFHIYGKDNSESHLWDMEWFSSQTGILTPYKTPREKFFKKYYEEGQKGKKLHIEVIGEEEIEAHYEYLKSLPVIGDSLKEAFDSGVPLPKSQIDHVAYFEQGHLLFITYEPVPDAHEIFVRFAKVFQQTYTRFLDLQNAESQVRESEIQLALERVRARTMAMHNSNELGEVASVLFEQISSLTSTPDRFNIGISNEEDQSIDIWVTDQKGHKITQKFKAETSSSPVIAEIFRCWKKRENQLILDLHGEKLENWVRYMGGKVGVPFRKGSVKDHRFISSVFFSHGFIGVTTHEEPDSETIHLLERFSNVFQQTYIRFLDLQKAEEQAREAQIEASLERVRGRAMAIRESDELRQLIALIFEELKKLEFELYECNIVLIDRETHEITLWGPGWEDLKLPRSYKIIPWDHPFLNGLLEDFDKDVTYRTFELGGKSLQNYFKVLFRSSDYKDAPQEYKDAVQEIGHVFGSHAMMTYGALEAIGSEPLHEDKAEILKRFAKAIDLAYTRFLDVQRAEKLALETARQASLDRIRAEIASMRNTEDLQQITPIIWDELKTLEIPFIRCGVFIIDEENELSHTYLSTAQGDPIAALHLPLDGISLIENLRECWSNHEIYTVHWNEQDFNDWTQNLIDGGFIQSKKKYEAGSTPETLDLHFLPFKQGMLYIGNTEPLPQEKLDLGQSMADAFSVAYDRYEDFNKLEQAKQKIEEAFRELEAAKDQLVQQEKLASLGQLTAGIAHEIKNPLNFVNNFSDLSIELVVEARQEVRQVTADGGPKNSPLEGSAEAERRRGVSSSVEHDQSENGQNPNHDLIFDILDDIEMNLKKIHEHGTRADGIVKSMLQHSRGGSGKMEPTDVNALIKEYANLAFHGMRAGKDPINVDIDLDLSENVGEIDLIAEDFSRVILNLCNNAFDAMREKMSAISSQQSEKSTFKGGKDGEAGQGGSSLNEYQPKLSIRTQRDDGTLTIEIQDNGPGIPNEIKDKILHPFFTTKKGTQGTGLGLSITSDIIKAHGGDLQIDSVENEGTVFSIRLHPKK